MRSFRSWLAQCFHSLSEWLEGAKEDSTAGHSNTVRQPDMLVAMRKGRNVKQYGIHKRSYVVIEKPEGGIELQVHHTNHNVRELIKRNSGYPRYFLEHIASFRVENPRAKYWLGQVINDYRSYFAENMVDITFYSDK